MAQFPIRIEAVTIAASASLSSAAYCGDADFVGILMPATWTSASITIQGGIPIPDSDGSSQASPTYTNLFNSGGTEVTITAPAASEQITIPEDLINGCIWVKIRSGTSGSPVTQDAARTLYLIFRKRPQYMPR